MMYRSGPLLFALFISLSLIIQGVSSNSASSSIAEDGKKYILYKQDGETDLVVVNNVEGVLWDRARKFADTITGHVEDAFTRLRDLPEHNQAIQNILDTASALTQGAEHLSDTAGQLLAELSERAEDVDWKEAAKDLGDAVQAMTGVVVRVGVAVMIGGDVEGTVRDFRDGVEKIADSVEKLVLDFQVSQDDAAIVRLREKKTAVLGHLDRLIELIHTHPLIGLLIGGIVFLVGIGLLGWPLAVRILGFGARGPVKGTLAAWAQRYFWGAAVARGSWFAWFQSIGMLGPRLWAVIWQFLGALLTGVGAFSLKEAFESMWGSIPENS